jgi:hypothetical protein
VIIHCDELAPKRSHCPLPSALSATQAVILWQIAKRFDHGIL